MLSTLIYIAVFVALIALVMGITAWFIQRTDWGFAGILIPFLIVAAFGIAVIVGVVAILVIAIARGQFVPVLLTVVAISTTLALSWFIHAAIKRPVWEAEIKASHQRAEVRQRENRFLTDYGPFLKAAANGKIETVREMLDWGMPFYEPSPDAAPRYDQAWVEELAGRADVTGMSIFGYSALELAAWHGHTEIVSLLVSRERAVPGQANRHRFGLHQAEKFGHEETAAVLRGLVSRE